MDADEAARQRFVLFPPRWRHVLVPLAPRRAAALGTTLYTASRPRPLAAQRALWLLARAGGGRLLPGPREEWAPPVPIETWRSLWDAWTALLGPVDGLALYTRPQASRSGLVLALSHGQQASVVRLRAAAADLDMEERVAAAVASGPVRSFAVPGFRGRGHAGGWHWLASAAMTRRPHAPVLALAPEVLEDVQRTVSAAVPAPSGTPSHWRPAHGDLTPWNLRRAGSRTWLIDWEDAGWAPPHADAVYFSATAATLGARQAPVDGSLEDRAEARAYWSAIVERRARDDADVQLSVQLAAELQRGC